MSDLIEALKKASWHTIGVMIPGITVLLMFGKIYVDTSRNGLERIMTERIESVRKMQAETSNEMAFLRTEFLSVLRERRSSCIKGSTLNGKTVSR
jgi:hypothetical protein